MSTTATTTKERDFSGELATKLREIWAAHPARRAAIDAKKARQRLEELDELYFWIKLCMETAAANDKYAVEFMWDAPQSTFTCCTLGLLGKACIHKFSDVDEPDVQLMLRERFKSPDFVLTFQKDGESVTARRFFVAFVTPKE